MQNWVASDLDAALGFAAAAYGAGERRSGVALGVDGFGAGLCLGLTRFLAGRWVVRDLDFAEVEGHAGDALRDAVGRRQAAEVGGGLQGSGLDHRESFS